MIRCLGIRVEEIGRVNTRNKYAIAVNSCFDERSGSRYIQLSEIDTSKTAPESVISIITLNLDDLRILLAIQEKIYNRLVKLK
jgi:hypothetical protein